MPPTERSGGGGSHTPVAVSPVGRRAARDYWAAPQAATCAEALALLHDLAARAPNAPLHSCYVVDEGQRLLGCAAIVAVVAAAADTPIVQVMTPRTIPIPEGAPEEAIQDFFITYGLTSFPVVDRDGRLCGVVGVEHFSDLVFEGFESQVREETYRSVGLSARETEHSAAGRAAIARLPWLVITLLGGFLAAVVLANGGLPPATLAAMAVFLPLCVALAERITQRTLTLRGSWAGDRAALARRELAAAALIALVIGPLAGALAFLWPGSTGAALAVGGAALLTAIAAALIGVLVPVSDKAGSRATATIFPIALALADVAAVAIYLGLVRLLAGGTP